MAAFKRAAAIVRAANPHVLIQWCIAWGQPDPTPYWPGAYDAATNAYVKCVDAAVEHIAQQSSGTAAPSDLQALKVFGVRAHNTAIDQEQAVVDQFNGQVRTYKAKHPKS